MYVHVSTLSQHHNTKLTFSEKEELEESHTLALQESKRLATEKLEAAAELEQQIQVLNAKIKIYKSRESIVDRSEIRSAEAENKWNVSRLRDQEECNRKLEERNKMLKENLQKIEKENSDLIVEKDDLMSAQKKGITMSLYKNIAAFF